MADAEAAENAEQGLCALRLPGALFPGELDRVEHRPRHAGHV